MEKLIGFEKINTAVFISGTGSNFKNLIEFSKTKKSKIDIKIVISNNSKAKGLNFAKRFKIQKKIINYSNINKAENQILKYLNRNKIHLICLAGFMKVLTAKFIKKFKGKILNIHPSLLPKYKGLNTHQRVLENNEKYSGCTVHYVNTKLDGGKIILQKKVKVYKNDTPKSLAKRILKQEHILYKKAINKVSSNF
tara:strand:- start:543 stop:1127 length:585 start_codon:yes stop_codon:yes gene_type:complete